MKFDKCRRHSLNEDIIDISKKPEKCTNCNNMQTGIKDGFCCKKCKKGKGHGRRC